MNANVSAPSVLANLASCSETTRFVAPGSMYHHHATDTGVSVAGKSRQPPAQDGGMRLMHEDDA